jgi:hypothetical protein
MAAPVINTVVKNAPNLATNWVEGTDFAWMDGGLGTRSTGFVDVTGGTSKNNSTGANNISGNECYVLQYNRLYQQHNSYWTYSKSIEDGVEVETKNNQGTANNYTPYSRYGAGKTTYSIQDNDFGETITLNAATSQKFQGRSSNASYTAYVYTSISWWNKAKADTLLADRISCCNKGADGSNSGKMYVDSFTFICHGNGSLTSSGLSRFNNNAKYFPTHQVKNMIDGLNYTTGGTSNFSGDYAIFIEGVFLEMT